MVQLPAIFKSFLVIVLFSFSANASSSTDKKTDKKNDKQERTKVLHCVFSMGSSTFKKSCNQDGVTCGKLINSSCKVKEEKGNFFGNVKLLVAD